MPTDHVLDAVIQFSAAHVLRPWRSYPFTMWAWRKSEIPLLLLAHPLSVTPSRCSPTSPHHAAPPCTSLCCHTLHCCSTACSHADHYRLRYAKVRPSSLPPSLHRVESVPEPLYSCTCVSAELEPHLRTTIHREEALKGHCAILSIRHKLFPSDRRLQPPFGPTISFLRPLPSPDGPLMSSSSPACSSLTTSPVALTPPLVQHHHPPVGQAAPPWNPFPIGDEVDQEGPSWSLGVNIHESQEN
jgi:hypothetical protein